jgi:hypothetical protein
VRARCFDVRHRRSLRHDQDLVDSSRILFGSDYVLATQAIVPLTIKGVKEYAGFSRQDLATVANGTAMSLFARLKDE